MPIVWDLGSDVVTAGFKRL